MWMQRREASVDTLKCTSEELAVLELTSQNPSMKQKELVTETNEMILKRGSI